MTDNYERLEQIIARMQTIQRAIRASGQPASLFELQELKDLGIEYARLVEMLSRSVDDPTREQ